MRLKVFLPSKALVDESVLSITGESPLGGFTLRPRHIDMATAIVPSILSYLNEADEQRYLAVDHGIVIKRGEEVTVATNRAVLGELGNLEKEVRLMLAVADERERSSRAAVARLEADFVRRFLEFKP